MANELRHSIKDKDGCTKQNQYGGSTLDRIRYLDVPRTKNNVIPLLEHLRTCTSNFTKAQGADLDECISFLKALANALTPAKEE